jgi:hypothetical protein
MMIMMVVASIDYYPFSSKSDESSDYSEDEIK